MKEFPMKIKNLMKKEKESIIIKNYLTKKKEEVIVVKKCPMKMKSLKKKEKGSLIQKECLSKKKYLMKKKIGKAKTKEYMKKWLEKKFLLKDKSF